MKEAFSAALLFLLVSLSIICCAEPGDSALSAKPYSLIPVEAFVAADMVLKNYWNPNSLLFNPTNQPGASQDHPFAITTMVLPGPGQQKNDQQSQASASSGQQASGTTSRLKRFFAKFLPNRSEGNGNPEQHQHTYGLNCYADSCNGVCRFRPPSDSERLDEADDTDDTDDTDEKCIICFEPLQKEMTVVLHCCSMKISRKCLRRLAPTRGCPLCRADLRSLLQPEDFPVSAEAQQDLSDSYNEPPGATASQTASFVIPPDYVEGLEQHQHAVGLDGYVDSANTACRFQTPSDSERLAEAGEAGEECPICFSPLKKETTVVVPCCSKKIDSDCLRKLPTSSCPFCRADLSFLAETPDFSLSEAPETCPICLVMLGDDTIVTPCCSQRMDRYCLLNALVCSGRCPLCRTDISSVLQSLGFATGAEARPSLTVSFSEPQGDILSQTVSSDMTARASVLVCDAPVFGGRCLKICKNAQALWQHKSRVHTEHAICDETVIGQDGQQRPCGAILKNCQALIAHKKGYHGRR